jgi:hypothetical protein
MGANHPHSLIMIIYLEHPIHGAKVATMDLEAEMDEKNGWTRYNPDTPSDSEDAANSLVVKRKYTRKVETEGV